MRLSRTARQGGAMRGAGGGSGNGRAFTLVELLVVIGIIALLAGLLVPAVNIVMRKAEEAQARADVQAFEAAIKAYFNEYDRFPHVDQRPNDVVYNNQAPLWTNLRLVEVLTTNNPRKIVFLSVDSNRVKSVEGQTCWVDPWDRGYRVALDANFDNVCSVSEYVVTGKMAIVWSLGRDGVSGTADDIKSWE